MGCELDFFNNELHELDELGEPWRLLGNHPDGAFAKKANNSFNSSNSWSKNLFNRLNLWLKIKSPLNPLNRSAGTCL